MHDNGKSMPHSEEPVQVRTPRSAVKRVLVPVHSVGIGQRLLDVAELLDRDPGLDLVFTTVPTTTANGVDGLLREAGVATLDWSHALDVPRDLVLATNHDHLRELGTPSVVIPDPCGRRRPVRRSPQGDPEPTTVDFHTTGRGTPADRAPALRLAAHGEDLRTTRGRAHGSADGVAVVGDLTFDRLALSTRSRDTYRAALQVDSHHRLVVVVSAWGTGSLVTREPELLHRLTAELPGDRYRVAVLLHPAAWFSQDVDHLRAWMTTARTASVQVVDPFTQWRPIVASADVVIGARGSITLYSTGIGLPVLFANPEPQATTSSARSGNAFPFEDAPHLRRDVPLPAQLDAATNWHTKSVQRLAVRHVTSAPGRAGHLTRAAIYRMLGLSPPAPAPMMTPIRGPRRMI